MDLFPPQKKDSKTIRMLGYTIVILILFQEASYKVINTTWGLNHDCIIKSPLDYFLGKFIVNPSSISKLNNERVNKSQKYSSNIKGKIDTFLILSVYAAIPLTH